MTMRCSRLLLRYAAMELFSRGSVAINASTRFARLLRVATLGHAGPICIIPLVGEGAARLQGRRACRADLIAGGSRASEGDRSHPDDCDRRCQSELRRGLSEQLGF